MDIQSLKVLLSDNEILKSNLNFARIRIMELEHKLSKLTSESDKTTSEFDVIFKLIIKSTLEHILDSVDKIQSN
jgi:hypothetical protein